VADAGAALRAARLAHGSAAEGLWDAAEQGHDTRTAVEAAITAVDRLHRVSGIDALVAGGVLDRALREVHAVAGWIDAFRPLKAAAGRVALGLEPDHVMF
jgi:hypothetical protein